MDRSQTVIDTAFGLLHRAWVWGLGTLACTVVFFLGLWALLNHPVLTILALVGIWVLMGRRKSTPAFEDERRRINALRVKEGLEPR